MNGSPKLPIPQVLSGQQYVDEYYIPAGGWWVHSGDPLQAHVRTHKGKCTNGFANSDQALVNANTSRDLCLAIATKLIVSGLPVSSVDMVVSPTWGAVHMGHDVAAAIGAIHGRGCNSAVLTKSMAGEKEIMTFARNKPKSGDHILLIDDVMTSNDTVVKCAAAVLGIGAHLVPFVGLLVNRSDQVHVQTGDIDLTPVALIECVMPTWEPGPETCPLCAAGSESIKAKNPPENWKLLTDPKWYKEVTP